MCDERSAVEGLVSGQNQYEDHVPDGCICAGDLGAQHIERLCIPGELCGHFSGHPAGEPAHLRPERRLGGVWPDVSGEQKDAGGGKVPHRSVLRCGGCCDRRTVRNGDPAAYRNDPGQGRAVPAGGQCVCHPADQRYFPAAAVPLWGRKSPHDLRPDLCRTGCPAGRRRCRDG